jgi:Abortive infection bacteriophage resistance protein
MGTEIPINNIKTKLKEPKTFEEQLKILEDRNMKIEDKQSSIEILKMTNYYRITAYALQFKNSKGYDSKASFNNMHRLYKFDKRLRHLILEILESIEISLRTYMAYHLSIEYGAKAHEKEDIFRDIDWYRGYEDEEGRYHNGLLDEIRIEIKKNKKEPFVKHHLRNYDKQFPIWVIVELFSFGMLSRTYVNLNLTDKKAIAKNCFNVNYQLLESWLNNLSYIRNICAHYGRLYNKKMAITPMIHNKYKKDNLDLNKLFVSILAIKELTKSIPEWCNFEIQLKSLIDEYIEVVELERIGFPINWNEILTRE